MVFPKVDPCYLPVWRILSEEQMVHQEEYYLIFITNNPFCSCNYTNYSVLLQYLLL